MNAFTATGMAHSGSVIPVILILLGLIGIVVGVVPRGPATRFMAVGIAVIVAILCELAMSQLDSNGLFRLVSTGAGVWIAIIGAVVTMVAGLLPIRRPEGQSPVPNSTAQ